MNRSLTADQRISFTRNMRDFWADHGLPILDRAVIILVPTLIFAPAYVGWLR